MNHHWMEGQLMARLLEDVLLNNEWHLANVDCGTLRPVHLAAPPKGHYHMCSFQTGVTATNLTHSPLT